MSETLRFRFRFEGDEIVGPVRGKGGMVRHPAQLQRAKRRAAAGKPLGIYEPLPRCVAVYPHHDHTADGLPMFLRIAALVGSVKEDER